MVSILLTNPALIAHNTSTHLRIHRNVNKNSISNIDVTSQNILAASSRPSLSISFELYICSLNNITEDEKGSILQIIPQKGSFIWLSIYYLKKEQRLCLQFGNSNDKNGIENNNSCQLVALTKQGLPICTWFTVDITMFITNDKPNCVAAEFSIVTSKERESFFGKFSQLLCKDKDNENASNTQLHLDLTKGKYSVIIGNASLSNNNS